MEKLLHRLELWLSQVVFSIITPPLLIPWIARRRPVRWLIELCFGRLYGGRYQDIVDTFGSHYGLAMEEGLKRAREMAGEQAPVVLDCGTGTGYVSVQAAAIFPNAMFIAYDVLPGMLAQARKNCRAIDADVFHMIADTFALPLADASVDLVLVQNTMPWFAEFARVCRPGGIVVYVDTSSGWIAALARWLVARQGLFDTVTGARVDMGFYVLAQKATEGETAGYVRSEGETLRERFPELLRCPVDQERLSEEGEALCCPRGHVYHSINGFHAMLPGREAEPHSASAPVVIKK